MSEQSERLSDRAVSLLDPEQLKVLHRAVTQNVGRAALIQRCQVHKRCNVLDPPVGAARLWL